MFAKDVAESAKMKTRHKFNPSCPDCQRDKKLRSLFAGAKKALQQNISPENVTAVLEVLRAGVDDIIAEKKEKQE